MRTAYRVCPLCEAGCGLAIELDDDDRVKRIRGDRDDVFSHGFICPKGSTLKQLHEDPDWLRRPLVRRNGELVEATWDEAFAEVERLLLPVMEEQGRDAVAIYLGNPNAHSLAGLLYLRPLIRALGTTNVYSASTVDQRPKEISAGLMFGAALTVPVPDIDRTDYLLMLGANPYASNGSLATAPDWPGRIETLVARGGRLVVVDPRRSRTAEEASEHVAIRPGGDAFLLMAMLQTLAAEGRIDLGHLEPYVTGLEEVLAVAEPFTPEAVEPATGIAAETVQRLAIELAEAPTACVYGRIGTTVAEFGSLTSWLVDVLNIVTGNLDRAGGAMFTKAAAGAANTRGEPRYGRGLRMHRRHTRVRGMPETLGEFPVVCMAEEMDTPGEGQVRALVTVAGNPVLSTPNSGRLDAAIAGLDAYVAIDPYVNETTRHADVILPVPSALQKGHYDLALLQLAIRNVAHYSPPVLPLEPAQPDEWEVLAKVALIAQGMGADADPAVVDDLIADALRSENVESNHARGPERLIDLLLRQGPYDLTLDELLDNPHGIDLGALEPRMPDVLRTQSGMVELAPEVLIADVERLRAALLSNGNGMMLIGRRQLRSNNSWMHNVNVLVKGKERCTLQVHPDDAERLGLADGGVAEVSSRAGKVTVPVEVTDSIRAGVVSIPHGWGHDADGARLSVARQHAGVNSNILADEELFDAVSGTAVLNGIPVDVRPVA